VLDSCTSQQLGQLHATDTAIITHSQLNIVKFTNVQALWKTLSFLFKQKQATKGKGMVLFRVGQFGQIKVSLIRFAKTFSFFFIM
jgi:hypothetical protein